MGGSRSRRRVSSRGRGDSRRSRPASRSSRRRTDSRRDFRGSRGRYDSRGRGRDSSPQRRTGSRQRSRDRGRYQGRSVRSDSRDDESRGENRSGLQKGDNYDSDGDDDYDSDGDDNYDSDGGASAGGADVPEANTTARLKEFCPQCESTNVTIDECCDCDYVFSESGQSDVVDAEDDDFAGPVEEVCPECAESPPSDDACPTMQSPFVTRRFRSLGRSTSPSLFCR